MAYDEQSFQATITDLKDSLVNEDSKLNANLTGVGHQLTVLNENLAKLVQFTVNDSSELKEMALQVFLHSKEQNKRDDINDSRNEDDDRIVDNTNKQLTLLAGMTDILNLMSMDLSDIRNLMVVGTVDKNIMQQEGEGRLRERDMISQLVSKETMGIRDTLHHPGATQDSGDSGDAADVEDKADDEKHQTRSQKMLKGIGDSLKKMASTAGKVAKGGLIAALGALGLLVLLRLFQSETWKKFADGATSVINWLVNDAGIFVQVATILGLLALAFKPLLLWKGAKALGRGILALTTKTGRAGIADKVTSIKDKVTGRGGVQQASLGGAKPPAGVSKMGGGTGGGWTKSLASGTKNIGKAMKNIGKGAGDFFMMLFKGIGKGLAFMGNPKALLGVLAMAGIAASVWIFSKAMKGFSKVTWKAVAVGLVTVMGFGALAALAGTMAPLLLIGAAAIGAVGIALIPFAAAAKLAEGPLQKFGNIFKQLAKVPFKNLALAGPALAAMAVGFAALSAGGLLAGIADAFTNFFGSDPVRKLERIAKAAPGIDLMGRAFKKFLKGVTGFMDFLEDDKMDKLSSAFATMGMSLRTLPTKTITELGTLFRWWSRIELGVIEKLSELKISALDDNTTKNWTTLLDELGSFGSMFGNSLDDLAEMFDKLSKTKVGHLDWSGLQLKPVNKTDIDQYIRLIDKLIELAEESKEGTTFVMGDMTGTIMGRGSTLSETFKTSTKVYQGDEMISGGSTERTESATTPVPISLGGTKKPAGQVVKVATPKIADSVFKEGTRESTNIMTVKDFTDDPPDKPVPVAASIKKIKAKDWEKIQTEEAAKYQAALAAKNAIQQKISALGEQERIGMIKGTMEAKYGFKDTAKQAKLEELRSGRFGEKKKLRKSAQAFSKAEGAGGTFKFGGKKSMKGDRNKILLLLSEGYTIGQLQALAPEQLTNGNFISFGGHKFPLKALGFYENWLKKRLEGKPKVDKVDKVADIKKEAKIDIKKTDTSVGGEVVKPKVQKSKADLEWDAKWEKKKAAKIAIRVQESAKELSAARKTLADAETGSLAKRKAETAVSKATQKLEAALYGKRESSLEGKGNVGRGIARKIYGGINRRFADTNTGRRFTSHVTGRASSERLQALRKAGIDISQFGTDKELFGTGTAAGKAYASGRISLGKRRDIDKLFKEKLLEPAIAAAGGITVKPHWSDSKISLQDKAKELRSARGEQEGLEVAAAAEKAKIIADKAAFDKEWKMKAGAGMQFGKVGTKEGWQEAAAKSGFYGKVGKWGDVRELKDSMGDLDKVKKSKAYRAEVAGSQRVTAAEKVIEEQITSFGITGLGVPKGIDKQLDFLMDKFSQLELERLGVIQEKEVTNLGQTKDLSEDSVKKVKDFYQKYIDEETSKILKETATIVPKVAKTPDLGGVEMPAKQETIAEKASLNLRDPTAVSTIGTKLKQMRTKQLGLDQSAESAKAERMKKQKEFTTKWGLMWDSYNEKWIAGRDAKKGWKDAAKKEGIKFSEAHGGGIDFTRSEEELSAEEAKRSLQIQDKRLQSAIFGFDYDKNKGARNILSASAADGGVLRTTSHLAAIEKLEALQRAGVDTSQFDIKNIGKDTTSIDQLFRQKFMAEYKIDPKTPPRPLSMDPAVKKLDGQVPPAAAEGAKVANNSGNTNVTTSQYFMGESSKTGDARVLAYQGIGF